MVARVLLVWLIVFFLWSLVRVFLQLPEGLETVSLKPIIFVLPVLLTLHLWEGKSFKRSLSDIGLTPKARDIALDLYIGVVIGILFATEGLLVNVWKYQGYIFFPIERVASSGGIFPFLLLNAASSLWEEIFGRGYLYNKLAKSLHSIVRGAFFSSILMLFLHVPVMIALLPSSPSTFLLSAISIFLLSITNCILFASRRSLLLPILVHLFWNMTVALYI